MNINNLGNDYARQFGPLYDRIPKAVFAAVAISFAHRLLDETEPGVETMSQWERARRDFLREWLTLHENGLVIQKPPKDPANYLPEDPKQ